MLLGVLRHVGRSWTYDDICEANGVSVDANADFMDHILEHSSRVMQSIWVTDPNSSIKLTDLSKLHALDRFDGCIGSSDATYIAMLTCPH